MKYKRTTQIEPKDDDDVFAVVVCHEAAIAYALYLHGQHKAVPKNSVESNGNKIFAIPSAAARGFIELGGLIIEGVEDAVFWGRDREGDKTYQPTLKAMDQRRMDLVKAEELKKQSADLAAEAKRLENGRDW